VSDLTWSVATKSDIPRLQAFRCTELPEPDAGGRRPPHPRPWERDVQWWIRRQKPPNQGDPGLQVAEQKGHSLAAVGAFALLDVESGMAIVKLQALAVSLDLRGQGGATANAALRHLLDCSFQMGRAAGAAETLVIGWIDPRNRPSSALAERHGFTNHGTTSGGFEDWRLLLRGAS